MKITRFNFVPFSRKQLQVLSWWSNPRTLNQEAIICDGSVRAGKTVVMALSYILWSMTNFSGQQFGMAGKTIGSFRRNVLRPLRSMLESEGYNVYDSRSENMITISKNGHTNFYFIFGGKDEASQDLVQGITLAGFFFDEVALMPQSFVNQATARCSVTGSKMWFNCNPSGPFHWFKLNWIDQMKDKRALRIHFTMHDNFDKDTMVVNELPNHFEKYYVSCDYGTLNPTAFLLWGRNHGVWYLVKEYYYSGRTTSRQKTDEEYCHDLKEFLGDIRAEMIIDPSAASFSTTLRQNGFKVRKAKNDVLDGIRVTQTAMNEGKIKFSMNCPNLFKELASYVWDEKAAEHGDDKPVKQHDHACDAMRYFVYTVIYKRVNAKVTKRPLIRGL